MGAQGTATIDFGSTPVSEASIAVTGQGSIGSSSFAEAFLQDNSTGDNDAAAHKALAFLAKCYCDTLIAGTGFTIRVLMTDGSATGTFKVNWVWN